MKFRNPGPFIAACMGRRIVHSPQEAGREPREEARRCECPFLGRHANPPGGSDCSCLRSMAKAVPAVRLKATYPSKGTKRCLSQDGAAGSVPRVTKRRCAPMSLPVLGTDT